MFKCNRNLYCFDYILQQTIYSDKYLSLSYFILQLYEQILSLIYSSDLQFEQISYMYQPLKTNKKTVEERKHYILFLLSTTKTHRTKVFEFGIGIE